MSPSRTARRISLPVLAVVLAVGLKTISSWVVIGTADQVIPPAELTVMARRAGARITDVNAGHLSLISDPSAVTRVILQAVQATG